MSQLLRNSCVFCFFLTSVLPGSAQPPANEEVKQTPAIKVRVYNFARVSSKMLAEAESEAARILREASLEIAWLDCSPSSPDRPECQQPVGPAELSLRIIPKMFGSTTAKFQSTDLGFAPPDKEGGVMATIFYDRVERTAKGGKIFRILGNAIAHEFGHLLLGPDAHSKEGMMRAHWDREQLKLATEGELQFSKEQSDLMRANISARLNRFDSRSRLVATSE